MKKFNELNPQKSKNLPKLKKIQSKKSQKIQGCSSKDRILKKKVVKNSGRICTAKNQRLSSQFGQRFQKSSSQLKKYEAAIVEKRV